MKNILSIIFILVLGLSVSGQTSQFAKGDLVTPKFSKTAITFDKVKIWSATNQYSAVVSKTPNGNYQINGSDKWQGFFPYLAEFHIKEFEISKKKPSRVLLLGTRILIEITIPLELNISDVLNTILFKGSVEELTKSPYFQELEKKHFPVLFLDKLAAIPFEAQRKLMRDVNYSILAYNKKDFKEKTYFSAEMENDVVYNTLKLNQAARAARQTEDAIKKAKSIFQITGKLQGVEGIKIATDIYSKDFLNKFASNTTERYEMYVSFDLLQKFIDAEITNQELVDGSIILVEGSRVKINLTNFS
jgi:hypothetical protein